MQAMIVLKFEETASKLVVRHVMMVTQLAMIDEVLTEHQLKVSEYDLEGIRTHQTHAHSETKTMVGIKMIQIIQLNASHIEAMDMRLELRNVMIII